MTTTTSSGPSINQVNTTQPPHHHDDVESPSLSSSNALARFEFEPGRSSKDGTKVLMVEWEDDNSTEPIDAEWEISFPGGKRTTLPSRDPKRSPPTTPTSLDEPNPSLSTRCSTSTNPNLNPNDKPSTSSPLSDPPINRLYFLLGAGIPIPAAVWLQKGPVTWRTNPLPAIFPAELGATARQAGKKGVLHTVWAKKRLQVLQREIEAETAHNAEGVGLEMAVAEKEWIEQNFGVMARPGRGVDGGSVGVVSQQQQQQQQQMLSSPTSPRSPGGGRLMDKLKGLKIGTSERELKSAGGGGGGGEHNPLSPESSDVAVSGFSSFAMLKGGEGAERGRTAGVTPAPAAAAAAAAPGQGQKRIAVVQRPPDGMKWAPQQGGGMASLNALSQQIGHRAPQQQQETNEDDGDDELFALPMSPRSPDMAKSPFSFARQDALPPALNGRVGG